MIDGLDTALVKSTPDECHWTSLMISQHWFRWWLGAVRQQAITRANVNPDRCCHMASLGHNELVNSFAFRLRVKTTQVIASPCKTSKVMDNIHFVLIFVKYHLDGISCRSGCEHQSPHRQRRKVVFDSQCCVLPRFLRRGLPYKQCSGTCTQRAHNYMVSHDRWSCMTRNIKILMNCKICS